ncbi:hypothetical protein LOK49_LG13G02964 [Camellia lanceoleosa]|uniref:Uncharacterized protein n=1 Tax=Camellia lanceoleosa TaxID=1840588 RepID=A0ACC0FJU5_9ERIC|nr:hypothetical protein LOK49_LG13G02964 [Camellia lanceoleosa]
MPKLYMVCGFLFARGGTKSEYILYIIVPNFIVIFSILLEEGGWEVCFWSFNGEEEDLENKVIICDENLKKIFAGRDRVGFLKIVGLMNPHFLK